MLKALSTVTTLLKVFLLAFLVSFTGDLLHAQIIRYDGKESTAINTEEEKDEDAKRTAPVSGKGWNGFKLGLGNVMTGTLPVFYEKALSKNFSLQIGAGIAFKDITHEFSRNNLPRFVNFQEFPEVILDENSFVYGKNTGRNFGIGYAIFIEPRYHFLRFSDNNIFLGGQFSLTQRTNFVDENEISGNEHMRFFTYALVVGKKGFGRKVDFDYGVSFGLRQLFYRFYAEDYSDFKTPEGDNYKGFINYSTWRGYFSINVNISKHFHRSKKEMYQGILK